LLTPTVAVGQAVDGPANIVKVVNSTDQTVRTKARIKISRADASDTEAGNLAYANSDRCTGCQSLAAAYQVVFVSDENHNLTPENVAVAVNTECHSCGSFAYAYQYVVTADRPAELRQGDQDTISALRREAREALRSGAPYAEIDAQLKDVAARFRALIDEAIARDQVRVEKRGSTERKDDE
jgi:hypothetical protein